MSFPWKRESIRFYISSPLKREDKKGVNPSYPSPLRERVRVNNL
jgi:hypothetical protein